MTRPRDITAKAAVPDVFDEVAAAYDRQVDLNPGYHQNLRRAAESVLRRLHPTADRPPRLLDVGCGTGASTRALALGLWQRRIPVDLLGLDGSAEMVAMARTKAWPAGVRFAQARVEDARSVLPAARPDGSVADGIFACYLLRNVGDPDAVLSDLAGLLPEGGVLAVHDYSVRGNPPAIALWTLVCWTVVIPLGWLTARHTRLYRYLWRSVLEFDSVSELAERVRRAGFDEVTVLRASGWQRGILHTVVGRRT